MDFSAPSEMREFARAAEKTLGEPSFFGVPRKYVYAGGVVAAAIVLAIVLGVTLKQGEKTPEALGGAANESKYLLVVRQTNTVDLYNNTEKTLYVDFFINGKKQPEDPDPRAHRVLKGYYDSMDLKGIQKGDKVIVRLYTDRERKDLVEILNLGKF